jgi:hypothetical protein
MAQDQGDKDLEQEEVWGEVAVEAGAGVLQQAPAATASAPSAGKKRRIKSGHPAMSSDVPSVGLR